MAKPCGSSSRRVQQAGGDPGEGGGALVGLDHACDDGVAACAGNMQCEECLDDAACAGGTDLANGQYTYCCALRAKWDPDACRCESAPVSTCGVARCYGFADCISCLTGPRCPQGVAPVFTNESECACPDSPSNCELAYCCADGASWDPDACACELDGGGSGSGSGSGSCGA